MDYTNLDDAMHDLAAEKDSAYAERDKCLVLMALMAQRIGLKVGMGLHVDKPGEEWDAEWRNILFIDLPAGQVSWHIHESEAVWFYFVGAYDGTWDGHTTDEKYQRVLEPGLNDLSPGITAAVVPAASISDAMSAISDIAELVGWPCFDSNQADDNFSMQFKSGGL